MTPPIYQCKNGHNLCHVCHKKVGRCPECRVQLDPHAPIRTLALERLIEQSIFKYPCINKDAGCMERLTVGNKKQHDKVCSFRAVKCLVDGCEKAFRLAHITSHLLLDHNAATAQYLFPNTYEFQLQFPNHTKIITASWNPTCIGTDLVCIAFTRAGKGAFIYVRHLTHCVRYTIAIIGNDNARSYTGYTREIDFSDSDEISEEQHLFVPANAMWYLTNCNQQLDLTVRVAIG